ncbi:MAG: hypothetical protein QGF59_15680, partial [Pirellulaceae bacterium]|nr:hypothetical protein [Pirellulaceae bacterium]
RSSETARRNEFSPKKMISCKYSDLVLSLPYLTWQIRMELNSGFLGGRSRKTGGPFEPEWLC